MTKTGKLQLELLDVYGELLDEKVDIILRHNELSDVVALRGVDARKRITIKDLHGIPRGTYRVLIDPPAYLPIGAVVNVQASGVTSRVYTFPVDPDKVIRVEFPTWNQVDFAHELLDRSKQVDDFKGKSGQLLYDALDDIRRAGLLNILAKIRRTVLTGGLHILDHLLELRGIRGDRFFVNVRKELREHVKNSIAEGLFAEASGALHRPPDGFSPAGSFKTPDSYGNLQLTFFAKGDDWVADIDIDDAAGVEHAFQVIRNGVTGRPTHPYNIQQILIARQELDPGYRLIVREQAAAARAATNVK